jgi:hypothetical protein
MVGVAGTRNCEQCGTVFAPRREHARFCSAPCRAAWNGAKTGDPPAEMSALRWSITAMRDATERLTTVRASDQRRAFAAIGDAVWWVTIVDGTLVRHHPDVYDGMLAAQAAAERRLIEGTLAGLRFVRNQMGYQLVHADFIRPEGSRRADDRITDWKWRSAPEPKLPSLPPGGQAWELTRYRAYQAQLAGHALTEIFGRATAFLDPTAVKASTVPDISAHAAY